MPSVTFVHEMCSKPGHDRLVEFWIAPHHAGGFEMQKLDGSGVYPANEGIGIQAIRLALQEAAL